MTMRIAIAGTGKVARNQYIPYLAGVPDVDLGYHNRTTAAASETAKTHGGEVFESLEALAAWKPDAALVLVAETCRDKLGTALIELGVPRRFFEKPLVARGGQAHVTEDDFARGKAMLCLAERRGCKTAMVFNYRFFDHAVKAKELIARRDMGRVIGVHGGVHYACWSHCIDLVLHLAGDVEQISATSGVDKRPGMDAAEVAAAFRLAGGGAGTLLATCGYPFSHPLYDLTFLLERGRIRIQDLDGARDLVSGDEGVAERFEPGRDKNRWTFYDRSFGRSLAAYLESLRTGTEAPVPGIAGLKELQFEAALKRSIGEGRAVDVRKEFAL